MVISKVSTRPHKKMSDPYIANDIGVTKYVRYLPGRTTQIHQFLPRRLRVLFLRFQRTRSRTMARFYDLFAQSDLRRRQSSLGMASLLNVVLVGSMLIFGRFTIAIPNAPASTFNISLVSQASDSIYPELRNPEIAVDLTPTEAEVIEVEPELIEPEPLEPEPIEPEPVELEPVEPDPVELELEPEPEPVIPEPEPEPVEAEPEIETAPEEVVLPDLDLLVEDIFSQPAEISEQPLIPDPVEEGQEEASQGNDAVQLEQLALNDVELERETGPAPVPAEDDEVEQQPEEGQTPDEVDDPLIVTEVPIQESVTEDILDEDQEIIDPETVDPVVVEALSQLSAEELAALEGNDDDEDEENQPAQAGSGTLTPEDILARLRNNNTRRANGNQNALSQVTGDDQFDQAPVFGARSGQLAGAQLPTVDLPAALQSSGGTLANLGGASGVIAIFCQEQFTNPDKVAECAGRVQILSGWRPGDSGEDYSRAVAYLRQARAKSGGVGGPELDKIIGPRQARILKSFERAVDLTVNNGVALGDIGDVTAGSVSEDIDLTPGPLGPRPLRNDPIFSNRDVRNVDRTLRELERAKREIEDAADEGDDDEGDQ